MLRIRVLFLINDLCLGGAQKSLVNFLRSIHFMSNVLEVKVLTIFSGGTYEREIPDWVSHRSIFCVPSAGVSSGTSLICKLARSLLVRIMKTMPGSILYRLLVREKFDIEIAYIEGFSTKIIAGSSNKKSKKYAFVHTDLKRFPYSKEAYLTKSGEKLSYTKFHKILCPSKESKKAFEEKFGLSASVAYPIVDEEEVLLKALEDVPETFHSDRFRLVSVGRLDEQKGYLRLLEVFTNLAREFEHVDLIIVGEGNQRMLLEKFIQAHPEIKNRVLLLGFQNNPYKFMKACHLFISSSFVEGLPLVMIEAMILGLPVVATETAGSREILGNSEFGIVTENSSKGLYEGIRSLLLSKELYEYYRCKALERARDFCKAYTIAKYLELLINK